MDEWKNRVALVRSLGWSIHLNVGYWLLDSRKIASLGSAFKCLFNKRL